MPLGPVLSSQIRAREESFAGSLIHSMPVQFVVKLAKARACRDELSDDRSGPDSSARRLRRAEALNRGTTDRIAELAESLRPSGPLSFHGDLARALRESGHAITWHLSPCYRTG